MSSPPPIPTPPGPRLSRADTAAAFGRHRAIHERGAWGELADLFAVDGTYRDPFFGHIEGREAIRAFLVRSMTGLEEWTFPIHWTNVDEGRVISHWHNRLPGRRRDGSPFEFPGLSVITFRDDGTIHDQTDVYDRGQALQVIAEGRSRAVELTSDGLRRTARPLVAAIHWLVAR